MGEAVLRIPSTFLTGSQPQTQHMRGKPWWVLGQLPPSTSRTNADSRDWKRRPAPLCKALFS